MPAPATTSHTSLPSQNGPIELIATRCSASERETTECSMPTPKSNPSSTKKPVHSTAMMTNQRSGRLMRAAPRRLVGECRDGLHDVRLLVRLRRREVASGVAQHQE